MESEKIILDIVFDVQKDFITGALANPAAQANVAHLADTAKAHAEAGHWMFFTRDTHPDNYLETREGRHLPVEHCIEGEDGWNLAPELENAMVLRAAFPETEIEILSDCCAGVTPDTHRTALDAMRACQFTIL